MMMMIMTKACLYHKKSGSDRFPSSFVANMKESRCL